MRFEYMHDIEQFKELEKGDLILVKWSNNYVKHTPGSKKIMLYNVYENIADKSEIICQLKNNHYFNYGKYLMNCSCALEVYKVID